MTHEAGLEAALERQSEYSIHLQRIIEAICHGRPLRDDAREGAPHHYKMAAAYLASLPAPQGSAAQVSEAVKAGWKLAPVEPTHEMGLAGFYEAQKPEVKTKPLYDMAVSIFRAMLAAATQPQSPDTGAAFNDGGPAIRAAFRALVDARGRFTRGEVSRFINEHRAELGGDGFIRDIATAIQEALPDTVAQGAEPARLSDVIAEQWQVLCDKDDRTSPPEYPGMALITREELTYAMDCAAGATQAWWHARTAQGAEPVQPVAWWVHWPNETGIDPRDVFADKTDAEQYRARQSQAAKYLLEPLYLAQPQASREAIIEECARIADAQREIAQKRPVWKHAVTACENIATAIRALQRKQTP